MAHRDWATNAADRLAHLEMDLRDSRVPVTAGAAVALAAAGGHAVLEAPELAWLTAAAMAVTALTAGPGAMALAIGAAVLHVAVDLTTGPSEWLGASLLRGAGIAGAAWLGGATGVLLRRHEETRRRSQLEDPITGLLNVRAFYEGLRDLRTADQPYAILLADIAGMRNLNERYGHPTGTEAMRALGYVIRKGTKQGDLVARLGSDEVGVALVGADRGGALAAARRLGQLLQEERIALPDGRTFRVHAHYGIAASSDVVDEDDVVLLRAADHAKLAAKLAGVDEIGVAADATDQHFEIAHPQHRLRDVDGS